LRWSPPTAAALLLGCVLFWRFIEGRGGIRAPVAIAGSFMIGLGFSLSFGCSESNRQYRRRLRWGGDRHAGAPLARDGVAGFDLSAMNWRILPITAVIVPFWLSKTW